MFGTDDDNQKPDQPAATPPPATPVNPITGAQSMGQPVTSTPTPKIVSGASPMDTARSPSIKPKSNLLTALPQMSSATMPTHPPVMNDHAAAAMPAPMPSALPSALPASPSMPQMDEDDKEITDDSELSGVKKKALQDLTPLIDKLDLPPEEKFKTLMMVVQASDKSELVEKAYEAASQIGDDKAKAQALLDIINEVNYFTKPHTDQTDQNNI